MGFSHAAVSNREYEIEKALGGPIVIHFRDELLNSRSNGIFVALGVYTPIKNFKPGKVLRAEYHADFRGFGVEIQLSQTISIIYSCLYRISVQKDMLIKKNQVIGHSGGGGDTCGMQGPGVRIKIEKNGKFVNPLEHLP